MTDEMERSETDSSGCVRATSAGDPQAVVRGGSSDPSISSAACEQALDLPNPEVKFA